MAASPDAGMLLGVPSAANPDAGTVQPQGPHDEVIRPTGLGRGVWEGPSWLFILVPTVVVIIGLAFLVERIGPGRIRGWFRGGSR